MSGSYEGPSGITPGACSRMVVSLSVSRTYTLLISIGDAGLTRFVALLVNATQRPSALITGLLLESFARTAPTGPVGTLISSGVPEKGSSLPAAVDRKTSATPLPSPGTRPASVETKAT